MKTYSGHIDLEGNGIVHVNCAGEVKLLDEYETFTWGENNSWTSLASYLIWDVDESLYSRERAEKLTEEYVKKFPQTWTIDWYTIKNFLEKCKEEESKENGN